MSLNNLLFGRPLASREEHDQRVGSLAGIPMLGLDALSSAAYGPEAAMTLLIPLGAAGIGYIGPISAGILFSLPTYLFVGCLFLVLAMGVVRTWMAGGHPVPVVRPPGVAGATATVSTWLLLRAFASGCTAMTGVEAVSNAVGAFREPAVAYLTR